MNEAEQTESCCSSTMKHGQELPEILETTSDLTWHHHQDHIMARLGINRSGHRISPGLYRLNNPDPTSPVFVSANYTLSFDALRSSLKGISGWILVIDTKGVNVWCAAGKGTFGTEEIISRIQSTGLNTVVTHRKIIVPQLGAPGVAAHEVARRTGFHVDYGPVRAEDLPLYLKAGSATQPMRTVTFPLRDRIVLIPVELIPAMKLAIVPIVVLWLLAGWEASMLILLAILSGTVLFPALMPWIPTKDYTTRGFILGFIVFLPAAILTGINPDGSVVRNISLAVSFLLAFPAISAYLALNFTGSTPFPSRTGVRTEITRYIRPLAVIFSAGILLAVLSGVAGMVMAA